MGFPRPTDEYIATESRGMFLWWLHSSADDSEYRTCEAPEPPLRIRMCSGIENNTKWEAGATHVRMDARQESIIIDILEAVAEERDVDPMDLSPLADHIDPESLERLVRTADVDVEVSLALYGCRVSVDSTGAVSAMKTPDIS